MRSLKIKCLPSAFHRTQKNENQTDALLQQFQAQTGRICHVMCENGQMCENNIGFHKKQVEVFTAQLITNSTYLTTV